MRLRRTFFNPSRQVSHFRHFLSNYFNPQLDGWKVCWTERLITVTNGNWVLLCIFGVVASKIGVLETFFGCFKTTGLYVHPMWLCELSGLRILYFAGLKQMVIRKDIQDSNLTSAILIFFLLFGDLASGPFCSNLIFFHLLHIWRNFIDEREREAITYVAMCLLDYSGE